MAQKKYLGTTGVQQLINWIKGHFVQQVTGLGLSHNDFTDTYKTKLDGIAAGADVSTIVSIKRNGTMINPVNKVVDISVPVKVSDLTNDAGYQTQAQVQAAVAALAQFKISVVQSLPATGDASTMYLVPNNSGAQNSYSEFLWANNAWEKVGDTATALDLSGYQVEADLVEITAGEIDTMTAA